MIGIALLPPELGAREVWACDGAAEARPLGAGQCGKCESSLQLLASKACQGPGLGVIGLGRKFEGKL